MQWEKTYSSTLNPSKLISTNSKKVLKFFKKVLAQLITLVMLLRKKKSPVIALESNTTKHSQGFNIN